MRTAVIRVGVTLLCPVNSSPPTAEQLLQPRPPALQAGWDATLAFRGAGHSAAALRGLEKYCIGILPRDERLNFSPE